MGLYQDWVARAEEERTESQRQAYWDAYFSAETENYKKLLTNASQVFEGTLSELAESFAMDQVTFAGFLDGINTSLVKPLDVEAAEADTHIALRIDFEKLYYNMLAAKAPWLYELDEWDGVLDAERRGEIVREYRTAQTYIKPPEVGRNDPCPCGSGKKYKKCCGAAQ